MIHNDDMRREIAVFPAMLTQLLTVSMFCAGCLSFPADAVNTASGASKPILLKGKVGSFGILTEDLQSDLGIKCTQKKDCLAEISDVRLGSEAHYRGLFKGDSILDARINGVYVSLSIEREGKRYELKLEKVGGPQLDAAATNGGTLKAQTVALAGKTKTEQQLLVRQQVLKVLACYDLTLVIDSSGSMSTNDCPNGMSRWQWCQQQAKALVTSLRPYVKNNISIITFNDGFDVFEHVDLNAIDTIFEKIEPKGRTDLVDPLTYQFNRYFKGPHDKPLLVAVITDGLPNRPSEDPRLVRNSLIECTKNMDDANQVAVTFLQIGNFAGQEQLIDLDENLVSNGARYDIVDTKTFDELQRIGLPTALVDAVLESNHAKSKTDHSPQELPTNASTASKLSQTSLHNVTSPITSNTSNSLSLSQSLLRAKLERRQLEKQLLHSQ